MNKQTQQIRHAYKQYQNMRRKPFVPSKLSQELEIPIVNNNILYIKRASIVYSHENLFNHFMQFGKIIDGNIEMSSGISQKGFVIFESPIAFKNALNSQMPNGIVVSDSI